MPKLGWPGLLVILASRGLIAVKADGYTWYSMEMIEGHTLQQLLRRDGPFSSERAMTVAYHVAKAMAATTKRALSTATLSQPTS